MMKEPDEFLEPSDEDLTQQLESAVEEGNSTRASALVSGMDENDLRRTISNLDRDLWKQLGSLMGPEVTADMVERLAEAQAVELLEELSPESAADIIEELPMDVAGDLLREMSEDDSEDILDNIENPVESEALRERTSYEWDSAGGLMSDQILYFNESLSAGEVLSELHENAHAYSDQTVQYVYVVDNRQRLKGVLPLRTLVMTPPRTSVASIMIRNPLHVTVNTPVRELKAIFTQTPYLGLPVIGVDGLLEGVVSREEVQEAVAEKHKDAFLKAAGIVGGDELRSMSVGLRSIRRLTWLVPNILLNLIAASVIAMFEETLQAMIALAVFLPIVSDMSGCSGNQAVAVSIRELSLNIIRPSDYFRVIIKEGMLGIINGSVLGLLLGTVAGLWQGNLVLGLVIGFALALNTVLSVLLGGMVPLFLRRLHADPALASGPILTTCTDMCGFFLVLGIASTVLQYMT